MTVTTGVDAGAAREILLRGPLTAAEIGISFIGEGVLESHEDFRRDSAGRWTFWLPALPLPADAAEVGDVAVLILRTLEAAPGGMPDSHQPLTAALGARAQRVYSAARDALVTAGLVSVQDGTLMDRTGAQYRVKPRAPWEPRWNRRTAKAAVKETPAPLHPTQPRPLSTAHGASSSSSSVTVPAAEPAPAPTVARPVAVEKPVGVEKAVGVVKVAAPTPVTPQPVPAPVVKQTPTPVTPSRAEHYLARIAEALERENYMQAEVSNRVGMGADIQYSADAARLALAQHISVLIGAHGPITRSELTANRLSKAQRDTASSALAYAVGVGGLKLTQRRYHLSDVTRLGWTAGGFRDAVADQKERQAQRAKALQERQAQADVTLVNRETEAALERVLAR